jgi:hypothetical protein
MILKFPICNIIISHYIASKIIVLSDFIFNYQVVNKLICKKIFMPILLAYLNQRKIEFLIKILNMLGKRKFKDMAKTAESESFASEISQDSCSSSCLSELSEDLPSKRRQISVPLPFLEAEE